MKVAIVGYGKMGKQIEKILQEKNIEICSIIDKYVNEAQYKEINSKSFP